MDNQPYTIPSPNDWDSDDYSYADREFTDEDDLPEKNGASREKSPERKRREAEFLALYNEYMHPTKKLSAFRTQCQQDDLYTLLTQLNSGWAHRKAARYAAAGFTRANAEDALSIGCFYALSKLLTDKTEGRFLDYPIAYYLRLAQNGAIDGYFRKEFSRLSAKKKNSDSEPDALRRRKEPYFVSIDGMDQDDNGNYHNDRNVELSYDPFAETRRPEQERRELAGELSGLFITELLNYKLEPQKPLAVMYGNILFQLAKFRGRDSLSLAAQASAKVYSPAWAHERMEDRNLSQLGDFSEQALLRFFGRPLLWGPAFRQHMQQPGPSGALLWGELVYTETYSENQTSDWIESITKTIVQKCASQTARDRDKVEFVEETFSCRNKFRKALSKIEKEAGR